VHALLLALIRLACALAFRRRDMQDQGFPLIAIRPTKMAAQF
jgi:hypothetical protein